METRDPSYLTLLLFVSKCILLERMKKEKRKKKEKKLTVKVKLVTEDTPQQDYQSNYSVKRQ